MQPERKALHSLWEARGKRKQSGRKVGAGGVGNLVEGKKIFSSILY